MFGFTTFMIICMLSINLGPYGDLNLRMDHMEVGNDFQKLSLLIRQMNSY